MTLDYFYCRLCGKCYRTDYLDFVCTGDAGRAGLWQCVSMMPYAHKTGWTGDVPAKKEWTDE